MDYLETDPLTNGWNRRTALLGPQRLAVPIRVYVATASVAGQSAIGTAYMIDRAVEWMDPAAVLDHMLRVKQAAELDAVRCAQTRAKLAKEKGAPT